VAKASPIINALNAGEWSPLLDGRTDIQGYSASAFKMENFIPSIQGPAIKRGGTGFVRQVKDSTDRTWLVPFIKSRSTAYQIEFGDLYCRFYQNRNPVVTGTTKSITGITAANPPVVSSTAHGYLNGDEVFISGVAGMTEVNGRWFIVANKAASTYELTTIHGDNVDGTGYTAYTSGGVTDTPYEIVSPYSAAALASSDGELNIDFVQTGDILYITDRSGTLAPRKLSRTSTTSWAFSTLEPDNGPWLALNATTTTLYSSAATGSVTLTASTSIFVADDIGSIIRLDQEVLTSSLPWVASTVYTAGDYVRSEGKEYKAANSATSGTSIPAHTSGTVSDGGVQWEYISPGYGIARITAQAGTTATATVLTTLPQTLLTSGNATTIWRKGAWSDANGYPTCTTFYRERLTLGQGQNLYFSKAADFENFSIDDFGEVLTESAISVTVQSGTANEITSLTEGKVLIVNTIGGEHVVDAPATAQPFGPNNIRVSEQTAYGAKPIRSIRIGESVLFLQASGKKLRAMQFTFEVDNFTAPDMTVRAAHIATPAITGMVRQEEPYQSVWAMRSDGVLLSFAFDQTQQVRAWARHLIAGTDAKVESVSVIPSTDGSRDDVWLIVSRTINGATRRYIEFIQEEYATGDAQEDAKYGDSMLTYDSTAATTVYGFDHLEGETVGVLADGAATPDVVVSNGEVTIADAASVQQIGLRFTATYGSNRIDAGAADGTAQGKTKRITDCAFRVIDTLGGQAGPSETNADDIPDLNYRNPAVLMGSPPALFTGDALLSWPSGYETDGRIYYINDTMFPATIAAIMPQVVTQEAR
jgi:hypothetical protein